MGKEKNKINEVAEMSRLITNKSAQIDKLELKKMFIIIMASVPDPTPKEKELALKELEKPFEKRNMAGIIGNNNVIKINKQEFFKYMNVDLEKNRTAYDNYKKLFDELVKSSHYMFENDEDFISGFFITNAYTRKNMRTFNITIDSNYMPVFWHLKGGYVKLLLEDITTFDSRFTFDLYKFLMSMNNYKEINLTTKKLKEIFNLSENDYVKNDGHFDRYNFEKKTLQKALQELDQKCKSITIFKQKDEKDNIVYFTKVKENKKVKYYKIRYLVTDPYDIVNSEKDSDVLEGQISIFDKEMEDPRSRKKSNQQLRMVEREIIEKVNKNIYNWLEDQ